MKRLRSFRAIAVAVVAVAFPLLRGPLLHAQAATLSGVVTSESGQALENANAFITDRRKVTPAEVNGSPGRASWAAASRAAVRGR